MGTQKVLIIFMNVLQSKERIPVSRTSTGSQITIRSLARMELDSDECPLSERQEMNMANGVEKSVGRGPKTRKRI